MRRSPCLLLPLITLIATACALPARDNPSDGAKPPIALLSVVALPAGADCSAPAPISGWEPVGTVKRGRCVALDVRGSNSPDGLPISRELELGGQPLPSTAIMVEPTAGLAVLTRDFILTLSTSLVNQFSVRFTDPRGFTSVATAGLAIGNSAPTALGDPERRLPADGPAWGPVASYDVTFDASRSFDPDGDPLLQYCWDFGSDEQCANAPARSIVRTIPSSAGRVRARLRVFDGTDWSRRVPVSVELAEPTIWTSQEGFSNHIVRMDGSRQPLGATPAPLGGSGSQGPTWWLNLPSGSTPRTAFVDFASTKSEIFLATYPAGTTVGSRLVTDMVGFTGYAVSLPNGTSFWLVNNTRVERFDLNAGATAITQGASVVLDRAAGSSVDYATADDLGRLWFVRFINGAGGYTELDAIENGQQIIAVSGSAAGLSFDGVAARPGTGELWSVAHAATVTGTDARLVLIPNPGDTPIEYSLPSFRVDALAWNTPDELWLSLRNDGLRLVDLPRFLSGSALPADQRLEDATLVHAPFLSPVNRLVPDTGRDEVWALTGEPANRRVRADGTVDVLDADASTIQFIDQDGQIWSGIANSSLTNEIRGLVPGGAGVVTITPNEGSPFANLSTDQMGGGLWKRTDDAILLYAEDGVVQRNETTAVSDGTIVPLPSRNHGAISPDGHYLWESDLFRTGVRYYDLAQSPPTVSAVFPTTNPGDQLIGVWAGPPIGALPFAWLLDADGTPSQIRHLGTMQTDGTWSSFVDFPVTETVDGQFVSNRSLKSGSFCAVSHDASNIYIRHVTPAGVVSGPIALALPAGASVQGGSVSFDATSDVCWVMYYTPGSTACTGGGTALGTTSLRGVRPNGTLLRSRDYALAITSAQDATVTPTSEDLLVSLQQQSPACGAITNRVYHYNFTSGTQVTMTPRVSFGLAPQ